MAVIAINAAGTADAVLVNEGSTTEIDQVADAGYTTIPLAYAAGSNGDTFVITDAAAYIPAAAGWTMALINTRWTCNDAVRPTGDKFGDGARIDHIYPIILSGAGGTTVFENMGRGNNASGYGWDTTGAQAVIIRGIIGSVTGAFPWVLGRTATSISIEDCRVELASGTIGNAGVVWNFSSGDLNVKCKHVTAVVTATSTTPTYVYRGGSVSQRVVCNNCVALTATGANAPTNRYTNCAASAAYPAGNNMSDGTDAVGTTVYNSAANSFIANAAISTLDMHVADRTTLESFAGTDISAVMYAGDLDGDNDLVSGSRGIGADWIAAAVSAVARLFPRGKDRDRSHL